MDSTPTAARRGAAAASRGAVGPGGGCEIGAQFRAEFGLL